ARIVFKYGSASGWSRECAACFNGSLVHLKRLSNYSESENDDLRRPEVVIEHGREMDLWPVAMGERHRSRIAGGDGHRFDHRPGRSGHGRPRGPGAIRQAD